MKRVVMVAGLAAIAIFVGLATVAPSSDVEGTVGAFQVVQVARAASSTPAVAEASARGASAIEMTRLRPDLTGMGVKRAEFVGGLKRVMAPGGFRFEQGTPVDVWLVETAAPPQKGYAHVIGYVVIDAKTGEVMASGVGAYND